MNFNTKIIISYLKKIISFDYIHFFLVLACEFAKKIKSLRLQKKIAVVSYKRTQIKENVIFKYIIRELLIYFFVSFAFFFVVFFVNQILLMAETILKKRVPVATVGKLIWYNLPAIVAQSAPFSTLLGFLMCLGRLVTDNEVLILRASGQRYSVILKPVIILGVIISLFSFVMNDYFLPLGTLKYNRLMKQVILSNPAIELESQSIKRIGDYTFIIGNVDKTKVSDMVIFDSSNSGKLKVIIANESNVKKSTEEDVLMQMKLSNPNVLMFNGLKKGNYDILTGSSLTLNIFDDVIDIGKSSLSPREMTSKDLWLKIRDYKKKNILTKRQLNSYNLEFNKKFSIPFGSIFFALLAFPLALVFGKRDGFTLGLIFGIILSVLYWAASILGQIFGLRGGYNGFWLMWGPNFFIGLLGIILYLRLKRK